MKVRNIAIDWMEGWGNDPEIYVLVDKMPDFDEYLFEKRGSLYFAEKEGLVRFFSYTRPGEGFGGTEFKLKMKDGSTTVLKGPWSSRSSAMNTAGFTPSTEVVITEKVGVWQRGYTFHSSAMTVEKVREALKNFLPSVELRPVTKFGEEFYEVRKNNLNKKELEEMGYLSTGYEATKRRSRMEMGTGEGELVQILKRKRI